MNNKTLVWLVVIIVIIIGAVWYFNRPAPVTPVPVTPTPSEMATTTLPLPTGTSTVSTSTSTIPVATTTPKVFTVTGSNFAFAPTQLTVKKGDSVTINFVNSGGLHDWKIDEFNAATKKINGGQTDSVTFVADKAGSFEYYCSVGTHRQMGMRGTLIVTP
jgi:plastocyanin